MALCPFATHRLLAPDALDPLIDPDLAVLHVDAGNASSLYEWWKKNGVNECHFFVQRGGGLEQYIDTRYQADAQVGGAAKAISIETQGYGSGEWTPQQLATIKRLLLWIHDAHPKVPLSRPTGPHGAGVGYHSMWPSSRDGTWARDGRTCPGPDRIRQYDTVLVPWMSAPAPEEDDMKLTDLVNVRDPKTNKVVQVPYSTILARQDWVYQETIRQKAVLDAIAGKLLTPAEVQAAAKQGAADALDEKIADATVTLEVKS